MAKKRVTPCEVFKKEIEHLSLDDLHELQRENSALYNAKQRELSKYATRGAAIRQVMDERRGRGDMGVSDHAVLRYLERHQGLDVKAIRVEILDRFKNGSKRDDGFVEMGDGLAGVMPAGVIATVIK